jgi:hypothetical protein
MWAGSGDQQAQAKICRIEIGEVAVAPGPPAGVEVLAEALPATSAGGQ